MEDVDKQDILQMDDAEFNNDVYAKLTIAARLHDIRLVKCEYWIKPNIFDALEDLSNFGFSGEPIGFHFDTNSGVAMGQYRWEAEVKLGRRKVLKHVAEYLITYVELNDFEERYARFYFEKVGRFATYPYFRSDFSHQSSGSGITLPPLPSLNERVN